MIKILTINSSPNQAGSTAKLLDMFIEESKSDSVEGERVDLFDYLMEDDFIQLKAKMINADGIVIASPYFAGRPSEELEHFIRRLSLSSAFDRPFIDKYLVGISVSLHDDCTKVAKYCAGMGNLSAFANGQKSSILCVLKMSDVGIHEVDEVASVRKEITRVSRKLIEDIKKGDKTLSYKIKSIIFRKWVNVVILRIIIAYKDLKTKIRKGLEDIGIIKKTSEMGKFM